ncbi:MAG: HEAT repeat domain-containing protein [Nocardioides sp.]|nr:HEAT repeat domain-containing protein [Nocardioides sp.]
MIPAPSSLKTPVGGLILELAGHLGEPATVALACDLLGGAGPAAYGQEIVYLTGHEHAHVGWADYWPRVWGARALLYVWEESAAPAVLDGTRDEAWRVAEMCLKVSTRHELAGAGDAAVALATHELPRVRGQAIRFLGVAGDSEHVPVALAALEDPEEGVRRQAARAMDLLQIRLDLVDP